MFKEENLGKFYIKNDEIYIVTGYNYLTNKYIVSDVFINLKQKLIKTSFYKEADDDSNFISYKDYPKKLEKSTKAKLNKEKYIDFYNKHYPKDKEKIYEYERAFNKLKETNINIKSLKYLLKLKLKEEQKEVYEKELKQAEKGLRKNKKIIYRYCGKIDGDYILDILKKNDYPDINVIKCKNERILKRKEELLKLYDEIIKQYGDFIKEEHLPKIKE